MNIHTFKLYRRTRNPRTGGMIISAFNIDRECEDPFCERMELCREFPRWAIGSDFKSSVDHDYETLVDPDLGEYGGTIDVDYKTPVDTIELDVDYKIHDDNTLKGPTATEADAYFEFENPNDEEDWDEARR